MFKDFSSVGDQESYASVPEGSYHCTIADVRSGFSRGGSERWSFRLEVCDGHHAGRTASWDSITWSDRGIYRVKHVLNALGFDTSGRLDVEIEELLGRHANIEVRLGEWEDPATGRRTERMNVPYLGYSIMADGGLAGETASASAPVDADDTHLVRAGAPATKDDGLAAVVGAGLGGLVMEGEGDAEGGDDEFPF